MPALTNSPPPSRHSSVSAPPHLITTIWCSATRLSVAAVMEQAEADAEDIRQSARDQAAAILDGSDATEPDHPSGP